jgi:hypothetical protein
MAFFTGDAVVRIESAPLDDFGGVYVGKEQLRVGLVESLMLGFPGQGNNR